MTKIAKVIKNCVRAKLSFFSKSISTLYFLYFIRMNQKLTSAEADLMPGSSSGPVASKVIKSNQEGISKPVRIGISRKRLKGIFRASNQSRRDFQSLTENLYFKGVS